jgi:hypothetical protein
MKGNIRKLFGFLSVLALVLAGTVVAIPAEAHSGDVLNCGLGTPQINGVMSPGEWDTAGYIDFQVKIPGGGTTDGTVFAMNDGDNLYLAVRYDYVTVWNCVTFEFDNDNSGGAVAVGDDIILFNNIFYDNYRATTGGPLDTAGGGTTDGAGALSNNKNYTVCELSHPLDSADDSHDFSLQPGDTVGFNLFIRLGAGGGVVGTDTYFPEPVYFGPDAFGDIVTAVPADNGGQPNDNALWGQEHKTVHQYFNDKDTEYYNPNILGDVFSNRLLNDGKPGKKGIDPPPWGPGGIKNNMD